MQGSEPYPRSERSDPDATGRGPLPAAPGSSVVSAAAKAAGSSLVTSTDSPTVRTGGSSAKRALALAGAGALALPVAGDQIHSFVLEESIGVGGMGAVFRAHDVKLDRLVALKILPPEQARDLEVVQRFYQEGRAAARLDDENIARVYTIDHDGVYHYIAFEYIEGTTIRQRVEQTGALSIAEAINYTLQIASALVHAAARGVVHRDIKPSNIIITPQGRAKLVDMGLARRFERGGDDGLTQSGMTLGTFDYISPEQARDPRDVDVRSDLYSLGCTLFHMLTGRPPFPEGTVLQKLIQHQENPPPDVRVLNPKVPEDLANILAKLMAKDRDRRYQAPEQLVRDLLTLAGMLGLRSVSPEGLVWISASRGPTWEKHLVWGIPALAFIVAMAGLAWWSQDPGSSARPTAGVNEPEPASRPKLVAPTPAIGPASSPPIAATRRDSEPKEPEPSTPEIAPPRDISVDSSQDLLAALASAPPRSIVVLADDGPYLLGSGPGDRAAIARLLDRDLTIKAAAGVRPVLRLARDARIGDDAGPAAVLDFQGGRVSLEGLEFVIDADDQDGDLAAIRAVDTELTVRRCLFHRQGAHSYRGRLAALEVWSTPRVAGDRPPAVIADACHFDGGQIGILAAGPVDLLLRDCTLGGAEPAVWLRNAPAATPVPAELRLRHVSLLASSEGPAFEFEGVAPRVWVDDSVIAPAVDGKASLVASDDPGALDWRGRGNLYARLGVFLQPIGRAAAEGKAIDDWTGWEQADALRREVGSTLTDDRVWDESDPAKSLLEETQNPTRAFRLAASRPGGIGWGARQGPFGTVPSPPSAPAIAIAANAGSRRVSVEPPRPVETKAETRPEPPRPSASTTGGEPTAVASAATAPRRPSDMPTMPLMPPMRVNGGEPAPAAPSEEKPVAVKPTPAEPSAAVIRTVAQLRNALSEPGKGTILRLAADADWTLEGLTIRADGPVRLRAEPGSTRPRIRFQPAPADPKTPTAWSVWIDLRSGSLQLEGIDVILPKSDAPRQGRWAAFGVSSGTDLNLINCTVTVEGDQAVSAVVAVQSGSPERERDAADSEPSAATVQVSDSLLRAGGDLVDVAAGRRLVLELNNAIVATGGSLIHAHGLARGQSAEPIRATLRQVTARMAGGLVLLESAPGEPELPVANLSARDSILATTPRGAPLFRVDGQDALTALRDRIEWEGQRVAYHHISTYRRDQTAQVGAMPSVYDRSSWTIAAGPKESSPIHGDVKFLEEWDQGHPAWTLQPDDVRLAPDSPVASSGPDLQRIPSPPSSDSSPPEP